MQETVALDRGGGADGRWRTRRCRRARSRVAAQPLGVQAVGGAGAGGGDGLGCGAGDGGRAGGLGGGGLDGLVGDGEAAAGDDQGQEQAEGGDEDDDLDDRGARSRRGRRGAAAGVRLGSSGEPFDGRGRVLAGSSGPSRGRRTAWCR